MGTSGKLRDEVFARDGNACVMCGATFPLEVAHLIAPRDRGSVSARELVTVCANCHRSLDARLLGLDFEVTLRAALAAHPEYRNVQGPTRVRLEGGIREVDITGERRIGGAWLPIRIECTVGALTVPRIDQIKSKMRALGGDGAVAVVALSMDLPAEYLERLRNAGLEVWTLSDIAGRFAEFLPKGLASPAAILMRQHAVRAETPEQLLLRDVKACAPGKETWSLYQQLVGRLLTHLLCPPLSLPAAESADLSRENRRDYVFPNYAESGVWCLLRQVCKADFVVVDAKNHAKGVTKREVLQVAHYLKAYGAGLFALIVCRCPPRKDARSAAREAWISQGKVILFLDDSDLETMVLAKAGGRDTAVLIRQKLEDFRLSL